MRNIKLTFTAFTALVLLAACSKNELPGYLSDPDAVRIEATVGALTKSYPLGDAEAQKAFKDGDEISVSNGGDYLTYRLSGGSWAPVDQSKYLKWEKNTMTFKAFYPDLSNKGTTGLSVSFDKAELSADQSTLENLSMSDYMTFKEDVGKPATDNVLTLTMERKTARVLVKISKFQDEFKDLDPRVESVSVRSSRYIPWDGNDLIDITSYKSDDATGKEGTEFYALVSPSKGDENSPFLSLTVKYGDPEVSKVLVVSGIREMEAGKSYIFNVLVGKDAVRIDSVKVNPWGDGGSLPGGETDVD